MAAENENSINQKQGVINKCPSCGGALKAFASRCELCGHELAGVGANRTITDLVEKFGEIESELAKAGVTGSKLEKELVARKARVIRDFPIPNAREDLQSLIYFIHPKIQDNVKPDPNAEDWRVKFREVLNLAKNAYKSDAKTRAEFEEIERSLNVTLSGALQTRAKRSPLVAAGVVAVGLLSVGGLASTQVDAWKLKQCEEKYAQGAATEKARLDGIFAAATAKGQEKKYSDALTAANGLRWEYQEACKSDSAAQEKAAWEEKRKEVIALIQKQEGADRAEQQAKTQREDDERRAVAERDQADKLAAKAQETAVARKAAISKEW